MSVAPLGSPWILRRYAISEYVRWFVFCIVGLDTMVIVVDLLADKTPTFLKYGVGMSTVLRVAAYELPEFTSYLIAPSALIAILIAISGMAKRNEITAILAGGIGRRSIVAPMAFVALISSLVQFSLSEYVVPEANAQKNYILNVEVKGEAKKSDRRNHWFFIDGGFLRVGVIDRRTAEVTLHDVLYLKAGDDTHPATRIEASAASFDPSTQLWTLHDSRRAITDSSGLLKLIRHENDTLEIALTPANLAASVPKTDEWGARDLTRIIEDRQRLHQDVVKETVDLHSRFAVPLAGFVMALLGAPFAFREHRRGGAATGIVIGIVIAFGYFLVLATALSFGKGGSIPPVFAAWLPNFVFGLTGIYLTATLDVL